MLLFFYNFRMKLSIIQPYDDSKMEFDETAGRYVLTLSYVKAMFGNNFHDDEVLLTRLKKNSRKIYNFIHYHSYSGNAPVVEFLLNKTKEGRQFLLDALTEQMEADSESGFNDLSSTPAVNVSTGQIMDREQLYANQISVDTEQIILNSHRYFGVSIISRTKYPVGYFLLESGK